MASPIQRRDGSVIDLDTLDRLTKAEKLELIQDVVDRTFAEDADKWEADKHISLEKIETILNALEST